ncbi:MAG: beta-ureidopropionase / N-carbamoyl-L-amino-acid hydrolase [Acidimicrobiia bacterium]|nr:beta-ureidopropionase / N-carbamoyl-L-amino-acid hydrolase [Acidimicrobiia bacterium]
MTPSMSAVRVDGHRLLQRLRELAEIGALPGGGCARLALTDADRAGRDLVVGWMRELGLEVTVDRMGNVIGRRAGRDDDLAPVMCGSHIDTVATGGVYDGNYGVLSGLEVVRVLNEQQMVTRRPLAVAFFSDEEGSRFAPDMLGSLVYAGGLGVDAAYQLIGVDGARYGDELQRIGYRGEAPCPGPAPHAYLELHIEQGPVLEASGITIGAVTGVQGISWTEVTITGQSNHAGTTPLALRRDAGLAAAELTLFVRRLADELGGPQVGTVGLVDLHPNLVNVVPGRARLTVDLRNSSEDVLLLAEKGLHEFLDELAARDGLTIDTRVLARFEPVEFDLRMIELVAGMADHLGQSVLRLPSGAGHDAQMLARVCPAGMIFVPSHRGISHNPAEHTEPDDLTAGANVLLQALLQLAEDA